MPYTCSILPFDIAGFFSAGPPSVGGSYQSIGGPPPATTTGVVTPGAPFSVTFPTATPPPPGAAAILVTDGSGSGGDLFRSGALTALPPSPGVITTITLPTSVTMVPFSTVATLTAGLTPIVLTPPAWLVAVATVATGGSFIPVTGMITAITPTLGTPPGTLTLTITGFFTGRVWFFGMTTFLFTGVVTLTPRPSGDALDPNRVLSVTATATTLTATGFGVFLSLFAPILGGVVASLLESRVNSVINSLTASGIAGLGLIKSPTSVLSARRVTITPSGIALQMVLADLLGPAITVPPVVSNFNIAVAPTPQAGQLKTYTVTVTDAATAAPVPGASVRLNNFDGNGVMVHQTHLTDSLGRATFTVTLEKKLLEREVHGHDVIKFIPPSLTVSKTGFTTATRTLL